MTLSELADWVDGVPGSLPEEMRPMAESICESFQTAARRLMELGLGYLTLDRAASTLSTGERQRMQLARAVRNRTTGVLYVLDEPSIGLHPSNIAGLTAGDGGSGGGRQLGAAGGPRHPDPLGSGLDHRDGPGGRRRRRPGDRPGHGGRSLQRIRTPRSGRSSPARPQVAWSGPQRARRTLFEQGHIHLSTGAIHTVKPLEVDIPKGRLTVVTGVSGSGKTTLILESLIPGLEAAIAGRNAAGPCAVRGGPRHQPGQADRRHAHRHQRPLHGGHLRQCPR